MSLVAVMRTNDGDSWEITPDSIVRFANMTGKAHLTRVVDGAPQCCVPVWLLT